MDVVMEATITQRREIAERIVSFILLSLTGALIAMVGTFLNSQGYWSVVSTIQIWIICLSYLPPYILRYGKYAEIGVYINSTVIALVIASTGTISGATAGNAWPIYLLLPPIAALVIGKSRAAIFMGVISGTIMVVTAIMELSGMLPVEILISRAFFIERLVYQVITMLTLTTAVAIVARRESRLLERERTARIELHKVNESLKIVSDLAEKERTLAEEANTAKSQFLANMSHELRTPLNAIINVSQFVIDGVYPPDELQRVIGNSQHLLGLINDVLDLSKIEAGHMEMKYEHIDLHPVLSGLYSTALGLVKGKNITVNLDIADNIGAVWADKKRIRQIVLNLLSNASKFTDDGIIILKAENYGLNSVRISVQDTGIGIAAEDQSLVFEEFRQVDKGFARRYEGTGLGLPIAKKLVEILGGQIGLESTPGKGSTFFFTLPTRRPGLSEAQSYAVDTNSKIAVVVDDDAEVQAELQGYLGSAGYRVHSILDSRGALDIIRQVRPDIVILDILMAERAGFDILAEMKATAEIAEIPVVMCSTSTDPRMSLMLGAARHILKPVRRQELLETLAEVEKN